MKFHTNYIFLLQAFLFFAGSLTTYGQVEFPGAPRGITSHLKAANVIYTLSPPDPLEIDAIRESSRDNFSKAFPFGIIRQVNLSPEAHGSWNYEGDIRVWRVHVISPGAYSLGVIFKQYALQPGVKLFVYDPGQNRVKGAFTSGNNKVSGVLPVGHIPGQEVVIEMQVPLAISDYGTLELESISHAFLDISHRSGPPNCAGEFNCSQACMIDVNCVEGDDWWMVKPSVVRLLINKTISEYCTGVLVNNTAYDGTPYILTAQHCIGTDSHAEGTVVQFNYESAECFGEDGPLNMSVSGAELIAVGDSIDFSLVKLSLEPPASYKVYYAGWDRSDIPATPSTTIHHPMGDVKKISFDEDIPSVPEKQSDVPNGTSWKGFHYFSYWWIKRWDIGTTEGGSSGGPLFNAGGRVIGNLVGGRATCGDSIGYDAETDRVIYNQAFNYDDYFARFGMAWDYEEEKGNELAQWLDPLNSGASALGGYNPTSVEPLQAMAEKRFQVFPNPASRFFSIASKDPTSTDASYVILNISGALLRSGVLDHEGRATIDSGSFPPGMYLISVSEKGYREHHKLIVTGQ